MWDYEFAWEHIRRSSSPTPCAWSANRSRSARLPHAPSGTERDPEANEALLDEADGLDWKTLVRCDLLWTVPKAKLTRRRGEVTPARRKDIARKIVQGLAVAGL